MNFICEKCKRNFASKQSLQRHLLKKACKIYEFFCDFCGNGYTKKTNVYRHMKKCSVKKEEEEKKENMYEKLLKLEQDCIKLKDEVKMGKKQMQQMQKEINIAKTPQKITNNINNGTINNNVSNITNNIALIAYGNEDFSKLDRTEILKVLKSGFNSCTKLTEILHFNPKYPEFQNVYIPNMKNKYAMLYNGTDWNFTTKEDLIDKIYDDKKNYIEDNLEEFVESLTESQKNSLKRWLDTDEDDVKITKIKESLKLLLYNKRNIVINTHKTKEDKPKTNGKIKRTIKDG
jgi:hypothetical protein